MCVLVICNVSNSALYLTPALCRNIKITVIKRSTHNKALYKKQKCMYNSATHTLCGCDELFGGLHCIMCGILPQLASVPAWRIFKHSRNKNSLFSTDTMWHHISHFPLRPTTGGRPTLSVIITQTGNNKAITPDE